MQNMNFFYILIRDIIILVLIFICNFLQIGDLLMDSQNKSDFYLHSIMCLIGGFLGAYAILSRSGNLGSAQTSNLIYVVFCFLGHNIKEFLLHFLGVILYFAGIELYVFISHKTNFNIQRYGIAVNMAGCILLSFIPSSIDPISGLLPIFFMMSTQWSVFHGANGYNSSTIFSTNNFRQTALGIGEYICSKDKAHMNKAKFFANSLFWYHLGVAVSFFACKFFNIQASLLVLIPCFIALLISYKDSITILTRKKTIA